MSFVPRRTLISASLVSLLSCSSNILEIHSFGIQPAAAPLRPIVLPSRQTHHPQRSTPTHLLLSNSVIDKDEEETPTYFTDLGLCPEALEAIEEQDRWYLPTPIQELAIPRLLGSGDDTNTANDASAFWCEAPTGSGKTAAFVLPLLQKLLKRRTEDNKNTKSSNNNKTPGITSLILCPTRELATQIGDVVAQLASYILEDYNVLVITGGFRREDQIAQLADWVAAGESIDVVIATPGRLVDVLTQYAPSRVTTDTKEDEDDDYEDNDDSDEQAYGSSSNNNNIRGRGASDAALERRLLQALDSTDKDSLTLEQIQTLKLDREDDEGREGLGNLLEGLQYFVMDEADRLLGRAFEGEVNSVLDLLEPAERHNKVVETWLFSATFPKLIEPRVEAVLKQLGQTAATRISCANSDRILSGDQEISATLQRKLEHQQSSPNNLKTQSLEQVGPASTINLRTIQMDQRDRTQVLKNLWQDNQETWSKGGVLVFVSTRYSAEHVSRKLRRIGIQSSELHGKLDQDARVRRLKDLQSGKINVLCATDLASRGLDVVGLSAVINYDLPRSTADFVHRVGRTGRAGRRGEAITFVTPTMESHFDLIERRHIPEPIEREMMPGFEVDEEKWMIQAQGARIRAPGAGSSPKDLAHDRMFGGIKGKRKSKKDRLREKAAKEAAAK